MQLIGSPHRYPILKAHSNCLPLLSWKARGLERVGSHSLKEGVSRALCVALTFWAGGISYVTSEKTSSYKVGGNKTGAALGVQQWHLLASCIRLMH